MNKIPDREIPIWLALVAVQLHGKNAVTDSVLKSAYEAADKVLQAAHERAETDQERRERMTKEDAERGT
jgi:uncharacterized protein (DUF1778 family)